MTEKLSSSDCDQCSRTGRKGRLKTCQINFTEAVFICTNPLCSFGLDSGETLCRSLSEISLKGKSKDGLCTTNQSTCTSHTKSRLPSTASISAPGPFIKTSKQPGSSASSTTWGSLHTSLPGVKNLGKDQIIQNFLQQLPLSGKLSHNVGHIGKLEGKDADKSSIALQSFSSQENPNSLSTTKSFTKLKLSHGFEGFQFNKKEDTLLDDDKRKSTEMCFISCTSEKKPISNNSSSVSQNDGLKTSWSQNGGISDFDAIENKNNCKSITNSKDVSFNSTFVSKRKTTFCQNDKVSEHSNEWKWERFLQWQNKDALCWLDVVLCLLVHNQTLVNLLKDNRCPKESVIFTLLKAYQQAQDLINGKKTCLKRKSPDSTFVQSVLSNTHRKDKTAAFSRGQGQAVTSRLSFTSVQTGAGNSPSSLGLLGESSFECPDLAAACKTLEDVREVAWQRLQSKLKCEKGRNDSPVLAFSALVQEALEVKTQFQMKYRFSYTCLGCGEVDDSFHENILPSFPNTAVDFNIEKPTHIRKCMKCLQESSRAMTYERLPNTLVMHFAEGLPHNNLAALDLTFQGDYYAVRGVIRYTNNPDHFTAWIWNRTDDTWMECDDLKSPVCHFLPEAPNFPPQEIHIVMWEKTACVDSHGAKLGSRNLPDRQSTNLGFTTHLDCQATKLDRSLSVSSHTNSFGKPVLDGQALKLGCQTSKLGKQCADTQMFSKGAHYKDSNSLKLGMEALMTKSTKLVGQHSLTSGARVDSETGILQKPAEQGSGIGTNGHSSANLVTCKCVESSDLCVCDQRGNELPQFVSTAFNRQTLLKPTPLHSVTQFPYSSSLGNNSVPVLNSLITDHSNQSVSSLEGKRRTVSKVSEKSSSQGLGLHMSGTDDAAGLHMSGTDDAAGLHMSGTDDAAGLHMSGTDDATVMSKNATDTRRSDSGFLLVSKAENLNKSTHFSGASGANTSVSVSTGSLVPTRSELNAISILRSFRKQRESKVSQLLIENLKPTGFPTTTPKTNRSLLKESNVRSVFGDSVSKEINVSSFKAGKGVYDSKKPSGTEQFLSTFGRGRGHSSIGSKFEGLKLSARNNSEACLTSAMTDSRMASPISSLCSEPVTKKQTRKRWGKQTTLKSSESNFEGLQILSRNSLQSFDSGETTACNSKGANISRGRGRKRKLDVTEEKRGRSSVEKNLNSVLNECKTKNNAGTNNTDSKESSQNSTGGIHVIQVDGEEAKNNKYLSDILSKFRQNNSVTKSTVIIIQNRTNNQEKQDSPESNESITCGVLSQSLISKIIDSEQNGEENRVSQVKTNNGPSLLKSFNLDLVDEMTETENSSPSKRRKMEKEECDILQDLYQALNIPLSEVGNAMSEIVSDVTDDLDAIDPYGLNLDTSLRNCDENEDNKAW